MFTVDTFRTALEATLAMAGCDVKLSRPRLCVALSGGLDSTVLLTALARLQQQATGPWHDASVRALHVDHGLHPDSASWSTHCAGLAERLGIAFDAVTLQWQPERGASIEAAARTARYDALRARLTAGEILLTAHHADDQLETILLQWLRGGGLRAVAGMERMTRFGHEAWLARPLLKFTRAELSAWATDNNLQWLADPANDSRRFDRVFLRHEVLPVLRQRWPAVTDTAARVAEFARDAVALEAWIADADLAPLLRGRALDMAALCALPLPRQRAALRAWLSGLDLPVPPSSTLAALRHDMAAAAVDRVPEVRWPGAVVRRYRGCLHAEAVARTDTAALAALAAGLDVSLLAEPATPPHHAAWHGHRFAWFAGSELEFTAATGVGLSRTRLPAQLAVRTRSGGEWFRPAGKPHRRELRKWLQEHAVLPWRRNEVPLLFDSREQRLIAVADLACADEFAARPGEPSWHIAWRGRGALTESDVVGSKWRGNPSFG
jgi:tRNA(Ile)-lysidine synthase